ncbi:MAG: adenylosuccinate lyase [Candidatus Schekmanbacteria bacterium RBG_13_48_7]|uniref:Adenylosuccinate lyase n=1 Tax=Candidatus Schekmanbacteria bacterium RBG_13_48_7 TaxID=1817878 RepID=A0A1F7S238_9BACT|nr:MAG: adenylosuccinate lyase [Candidatus Schekmanbacteria bacterium RBG_13_48_7]
MIKRYSRPEISSIWSEENKFRIWLQVELFACEALAAAGKIPTEALERIKERADFDFKRIQEIEEITHHDVIAFLSALTEKVGPDARFIHMGLTSSDILDTTNALRLKQAGEILIKDIEELLEIIKSQAIQFKNTPMIGRSHGIHAEPITFGLKLVLWYEEMVRNRDRMNNALEQISYGKISGAVGTYANIDPRIEAYVCEKLDLKPAPISTQIIQRDRYAEYMCTIAIIGASLEKFAFEIRHLSRTEVGELEELFSKGQKGSSAMPHKRNPIISERICGMARLLRGNALAALENVALWHERDISHSSVERVILEDSTVLLDYMLFKMSDLIKNIIVYPERMLKNLDMTNGLIFSQQLLLKLVGKGITREEAYKIVQQIAFDAGNQNVSFRDLVIKNNEVQKYLSEEESMNSFDFQYHLKFVDVIFERIFGKEP